MPLLDERNEPVARLQVTSAYTWLTRLAGLLHLREAEKDRLLHIQPCRSVHTFGMRFPIDLVALDRSSRVVKVVTSVGRNRIVPLPRSTHSILEGGEGWTESCGIRNGQLVVPQPDDSSRVHWDGLRHLFHWPMNFFIALLWSRLVYSLVHAWQTQGQLVTLGLLIHNTLLLVLFLSRRESRETSTRVSDWLVVFATLTSAMLLRPAVNQHLIAPELAVAVQAAGFTAMIFSLLSLGRSFGVIPANRQLKLSGAYKWVRHPLYTSELVFYTGFLLGQVTLRNGVFVLLIFAGQFWRAAAEERLLRRDPEYQSYLLRVRYRFLPGIF